jgi:hypothetical protein
MDDITRRTLLKGIAVMPFGNSRGQGFNNPVANTFRAAGTIINKNGIFIYSGTPALGNLIWADVSATGTDLFGNIVYQGAFSYSPSGVALAFFAAGTQNGNFLLGTGAALSGTGARQPSSVASGGDGIVALDSGVTGVTDSSASFIMKSATNTGALPATIIAGNIKSLDGTAASPSLITTDSWHGISLDAGWALGPQAPQYRLLPDGNIQVRGQTTHVSVAAVTPINSVTPIPAAYRPALTRYYRASDPMDTAGTVQIDPSGIFSVRASAGFPATQALMDGTYSI